jgi:hypothetical protein
MAVWLFASDLLGPSLFQHFHPRFMNLVWLNAGATAPVPIAVPLLPALLGRGGRANWSGSEC